MAEREEKGILGKILSPFVEVVPEEAAARPSEVPPAGNAAPRALPAAPADGGEHARLTAAILDDLRAQVEDSAGVRLMEALATLEGDFPAEGQRFTAAFRVLRLNRDEVAADVERLLAQVATARTERLGKVEQAEKEEVGGREARRLELDEEIDRLSERLGNLQREREEVREAIGTEREKLATLAAELERAFDEAARRLETFAADIRRYAPVE